MPEQVEVQKGLGLREVFANLKEQRTPYVVLDNWTLLPTAAMDGPDGVPTIEILTTVPTAIVQAFSATRVRGSLYAIRPGSRKPIHLIVRKKGDNLFPESFESELLARTAWHGEIIRIPEPRIALMIFLYRELYHHGKITNITHRGVIEKVLDERVGIPVVPNDTDVRMAYTRQ